MRPKSPPKSGAGPWNARVEVAPGLEEILLDELSELGLEGQPDTGGIELRLDPGELLRIQRWSRIASRVTVRLGTVGAESLDMLADRARKQPWKNYIHPRQPVDVRATLHRSRLRHRERVEAKVKHAIADALRGPRLPGGRPPTEPARVGVRLDRDRASLRIDASGELLHRRGWRKDTGRAPLRENYAAAVLRAAGWRPGMSLLDPMCGSGTFAIEAALWSRGIAPGGARSFACERWPCWPLKPSNASPASADPGAPIYASDRDERAIHAARSNADRAGVGARITLTRVPLEELEIPTSPDMIVLNPPWGDRLGDQRALAQIHGRWANLLRQRWPRATLVCVVPDAGWARRTWGEGATAALRFPTGGTRVVAWVRHSTL